MNFFDKLAVALIALGIFSSFPSCWAWLEHEQTKYLKGSFAVIVMGTFVWVFS